MEIGPVLLTQGHTHARNAHVTDVQYYGRRALSTKSVVAGFRKCEFGRNR